MADENITPADAGQTSDNGQSDVNSADVKSAEPVQTVDPAEAARRAAQSAKDKAVAENDQTSQTMDFLMAREAERMQQDAISGFLKENAEKYPHVTDADLKFAGSEEELEIVAKHFENRYKQMQQDALSSVQSDEVTPLTTEELRKLENKLEEDSNSQGRSNFGSWINAITRK